MKELKEQDKVAKAIITRRERDKNLIKQFSRIQKKLKMINKYIQFTTTHTSKIIIIIKKGWGGEDPFITPTSKNTYSFGRFFVVNAPSIEEETQ